jgi:hypothetical protein
MKSDSHKGAFISCILLTLLLSGCVNAPRNSASSEREVSDTRVGTVPELGEQPVTIRSGPRATR